MKSIKSKPEQKRSDADQRLSLDLSELYVSMLDKLVEETGISKADLMREALRVFYQQCEAAKRGGESVTRFPSGEIFQHGGTPSLILFKSRL